MNHKSFVSGTVKFEDGLCIRNEIKAGNTTQQRVCTITIVLGPSQSLPPLGSVLARAFGKESSAWLAMPSKKLGLACHILQKKLSSARLALSFKKLSYLEKQKMS